MWKPQEDSKEHCIQSQVKRMTPTMCQTCVSKPAFPALQASKLAEEVT